MIDRFSGKQIIETDVAIVGYGGAGATAAITAHDSGARVIILEKMPVPGGNTRVSSSSILNPTDIEEAVRHIEALCHGNTDRETIQAYVESSIKNKDWIREIGGESEVFPFQDFAILYPYPRWPSWPNVPGAQSTEIRFIIGKGDELFGERLWRLLSTNVERRGINVMTSTSAKELITDQKGEVVGVVAEKEGEEIFIKARRAVILTCGGFEYNEAMKRAFLPLNPFYAFGSPGNTGDGIIMAQKVGAALWHMNVINGYLAFKAPEYEAAFQTRIHGARFIYVDKDGRRFGDETGGEAHEIWRLVSYFDTDRLCYPHIPAFAIFDDVTRRKGPLYLRNMGYNKDYEWSLDNSKEVAKGWIKQGRTIRELAKRISIDESALESTVATYNEYCKAGQDADFDRSKETLEPIETAPYYSIELWPCTPCTVGGPRRDREARVLDYQGKPIPRLYSAGELGSVWGFLYVGGGYVGECLAFGRIAGLNAAAEEPW